MGRRLKTEPGVLSGEDRQAGLTRTLVLTLKAKGDLGKVKLGI